jgi:hypothetical protein
MDKATSQALIEYLNDLQALCAAYTKDLHKHDGKYHEFMSKQILQHERAIERVEKMLDNRTVCDADKVDD